MKIGLFGITGNPPHFGHAKVIEESLKQCEQVISSLVYQHPFGKQFIDYDHRKNLLMKVFLDYFQEKPDLLKRIIFSDLDKDFVEKYERTPYSYELLSYLTENQSKNNNKSFTLVIGEDNFRPEIWKKFHRNEEILKDFGVCVIPEQGLHSTNIRELFQSLSHENFAEKKSKIIAEIGESAFEYCIENQIFSNIQFNTINKSRSFK